MRKMRRAERGFMLSSLVGVGSRELQGKGNEREIREKGRTVSLRY